MRIRHCHGRENDGPHIEAFGAAVSFSYGDRRFDRGMMTIVDYFKVFVRIVEQGRRFAQYFKLRQWKRRAGELQIGLLQMIQIQMAISPGPYEVPGLKIALLRNHVGEQRIGGDIERHAQQGIGTALL